jgi:hypothetical protein
LLVAYLSSLSANTASQLNILGHDCDTLGVNGTQVGIFEKSDKVGLGGFLKGKDSSRLESKIRLEILGDFTNETLERSFADQKIGRLLVFANLAKSDGSGAVTVGLLDTSGGGCRLAGSLSSRVIRKKK